MSGQTGSLPEIAAVIPVAEKDVGNLPYCIDRIRRHSLNPVHAIYVIGAARLRRRIPARPAVEWIDEGSVQPLISDVRSALIEGGYRHGNAGWYFQQLLKLYAFRILGPVADYVLIHDADVALARNTVFVDDQRRSLLPYGYPLRWRLETRRHVVPASHSALTAAARLVPDWRTVGAYSGMQHHMVLDRIITAELFRCVEEHHGLEFWRAFLRSIEKIKWHGISEYVIYRHFALANFPAAVLSRHLDSVDIIESAAASRYELADVLRTEHATGVHLVGCHKFADYQGTLATMDYLTPTLRDRVSAVAPPISLRLNRGLLTMQTLETSNGITAARAIPAADAPDAPSRLEPLGQAIE